MVLVFDIGGTSLKLAVINNQQKKVVAKTHKYSDDSNYLIDGKTLLNLVKKITKEYNDIYLLEAICFSSCGMISDDGTISGLSAITNYSEINWKRDLQEFKLPIFIENDANCSLLAEYKFGIAQGYSNIISLVLGTGIGGAIIINNKLLKGNNAEFGYSLEKWDGYQYTNFSMVGSPRNTQVKLNKTLNTNRTFEDYLKNYGSDPQIDAVIDEMIFNVAKNIINISFVISPELFVIGGAISANNWFIKKLSTQVNELMNASGMAQTWKIVAAQFQNDANLLGAYSLSKK